MTLNRHACIVVHVRERTEKGKREMIHKTETKTWDPAPRVARTDRKTRWTKTREAAAKIRTGETKIESPSPRALRKHGKYLPRTEALRLVTKMARGSHLRFLDREEMVTVRISNRRRQVAREV